MVVVIPVQTLAVIVLGHLLEVVPNLPEVDGGHQRGNAVKDGDFILRPRLERRVNRSVLVGEQVGKALPIHVHEGIYADDMTDEVGVLKVVGSCQHVQVHDGFELCRDDKVLIVNVGVGGYAAHGVFAALELQKARHLTEHGGNVNCVRLVGFGDGNALDVAVQHGTCEHVLHHKVLIGLRGSVHALHDGGDKVSDTLPRQERLTKLVIGNGNRVILLKVHGVKRRANVGNGSLENILFRLGRAELERTREVDEDFLNRLAELQTSLLEHRPRVRVHFGRNDNEPDAVNERIEVRIGRGGEVQDVIANLVDGFGRARNADGSVLRLLDYATRDKRVGKFGGFLHNSSGHSYGVDGGSSRLSAYLGGHICSFL